MKKEETVVEERTVERTYCDECTTECTDNTVYELSELCKDCSTNPIDTTSLDKARYIVRNKFDSPEVDSFMEFLLRTGAFTLYYPLIALIYVAESIDKKDASDRYGNLTMLLALIFGTLLWIAFPLMLLL